MPILHPYQNQRVTVTEGRHARRKAKVVRVLDGFVNGPFVEVEFDRGGRDLIPQSFLDHRTQK